MRPHNVKSLPYDEIARMRANGDTYQKIGDHFGVTRERIRQLVNKIDPSMTGSVIDVRDRERNDAIIRLREDGMSYQQIERELSVCANTAQNVINKFRPDLTESANAIKNKKRKCAHCGREFEAIEQTRKYCGDECRFAARSGVGRSIISDQQVAEIVVRCGSGEEINALAYEYGVSTQTVRARIRRISEKRKIDALWVSRRLPHPPADVVDAWKGLMN